MFTKRFCGKSLLANSISIIVRIFFHSIKEVYRYINSLCFNVFVCHYTLLRYFYTAMPIFFQAALSHRESHLEWFVMANNQNCLPIISLWLPEGGVMQFWFHMWNFLHQKVFPMPTLYSNKILTCFDISSALMGEGNLFWIWQAG